MDHDVHGLDARGYLIRRHAADEVRAIQDAQFVRATFQIRPQGSVADEQEVRVRTALRDFLSRVNNCSCPLSGNRRAILPTSGALVGIPSRRLASFTSSESLTPRNASNCMPL
jgi:hypothetical protein